MSIQQSNADNQVHEAGTEHLAELIPFPIDMSSFLTLPYGTLNASQLPNHANPPASSPMRTSCCTNQRACIRKKARCCSSLVARYSFQ